MKYQTTKFKNLTIALKELEPYVRNGQHLETGKPFAQFGNGRSRELLANWLLCSIFGPDRLTFTSDPLGGDGIIVDTKTNETWPTEHVLVPRKKKEENKSLEQLILDAIIQKQKKGGAAYAAGKTLVVFLNYGGEPWFPNSVAKQLPEPIDFEAVWVVGLLEKKFGRYVYGITRLDLTQGNTPTWQIEISNDFTGWKVKPIQ